MKTIYCKLNDRYIPEYRLSTRILVDDTGGKSVRKKALDARGNDHILGFKAAADRLPAILPADVGVCPCAIKDGEAVFPFITGEAYSSILARAARGNQEQYMDCWRRFLDCLAPTKPVSFSTSEAFEALFGDGKAFEGSEAYPACAVDLLPSNLLRVEEGKYVFFDYEWWIDAPVPVELIKYHALQTTWRFYPEIRHEAVELPGLLAACGIDGESLERCRGAMEHFYRHILGDDRERKAWYLCSDRYMKQSEVIADQIRKLSENWQSAAAYAKSLEAQIEKDNETQKTMLENWESTAAYAKSLEAQIEKDNETQKTMSENWAANVAYSKSLEAQIEKDNETQKVMLENWESTAAYAKSLEAQIEKDNETQKTMLENWESTAAYAKSLEAQIKEEQKKTAEVVKNWQASVEYSKELEKQLNAEQRKTADAVQNWRASLAYSEELTRGLNETHNSVASSETDLQSLKQYIEMLEQKLKESQKTCEELLRNWQSAASYADTLSEEKAKEKKEFENTLKQLKTEVWDARYELDKVVNSFRWKMVHPVESMKQALGIEESKDG